jgi:hypothetical protein
MLNGKIYSVKLGNPIKIIKNGKIIFRNDDNYIPMGIFMTWDH